MSDGVPRVVEGEISELEAGRDGLSFRWNVPLPDPVPGVADPRSVALVRESDPPAPYRLAVKGLPPGRYRVTVADGSGNRRVAAEALYETEQLAGGVDLAAIPDFPPDVAARALLDAVRDADSKSYQAWRAAVEAGAEPPDAPDRFAEMRIWSRDYHLSVTIRRSD